MFSDKSCTENQNTNSVSNNSFPPKSRTVYEIMWKNTVYTGQATDDITTNALCVLDN